MEAHWHFWETQYCCLVGGWFVYLFVRFSFFLSKLWGKRVSVIPPLFYRETLGLACKALGNKDKRLPQLPVFPLYLCWHTLKAQANGPKFLIIYCKKFRITFDGIIIIFYLFIYILRLARVGEERVCVPFPVNWKKTSVIKYLLSGKERELFFLKTEKWGTFFKKPLFLISSVPLFCSCKALHRTWVNPVLCENWPGCNSDTLFQMYPFKHSFTQEIYFLPEICMKADASNFFFLNLFFQESMQITDLEAY